MDDRARQERDPAALQAEILTLDAMLVEFQPALEAKHKAFQEARAEYEVARLRVKLIKERRSGLQSVRSSWTVGTSR